jgi:U3 small nucleolar RNA-associated protein 7
VNEFRQKLPAASLSFSQRDSLATAHGAHVIVWNDVLVHQQQPFYPYMKHVVEGQTVHRVQFCPYEDILGVGHSGGFSSVLIPGAGEPNYDAYEANPFAGRRQRQEREVHALLDKLPIETISLDGGSFVGRVARPSQETIGIDRSAQDVANGVVRAKNKARGRSSAMKRYLRKRANVIDKYKQEAIEEARSVTIHRNIESESTDGYSALNRFVSKAL